MGYLEKAKKLVAEMENQTESIDSQGKHRLVAYSKVLGRNIVVFWLGDNPNVIYVDQTPYTTEELCKLKKASSKGVKNAHLIKKTFEGNLTDEE